MRKFVLALTMTLCWIPLTGCGGGQEKIIAPPAEEETSVVPVEGMSEEEYAKEMEKSMQQ